MAFHTAFALLEKRRIENYEEKGEVNPLASRSLFMASFVAAVASLRRLKDAEHYSRRSIHTGI